MYCDSQSRWVICLCLQILHPVAVVVEEVFRCIGTLCQIIESLALIFVPEYFTDDACIDKRVQRRPIDYVLPRFLDNSLVSREIPEDIYII